MRYLLIAKIFLFSICFLFSYSFICLKLHFFSTERVDFESNFPGLLNCNSIDSFVHSQGAREPRQHCWPTCWLKIGQNVGLVCSTRTISEMFLVADVVYKWSFANMAKKESPVCLLPTLFVESKEEKTRGPTQTASLWTHETNDFRIPQSKAKYCLVLVNV